MRYLIEWAYPVRPVSPPPPPKSVVKVGDYVSIVDLPLPTGGANVEFIDVTGAVPVTVTGHVGGTPGSYHGEFLHPGGDRYTFTASVARGFISGMIFRHGLAEDSGGHWGGR